MHEQQSQMLSAQQVRPLSAPPATSYGAIMGGSFGGGPGPGFNYGASRNNNTSVGNLGVSMAGGLGQSYSGGLGTSGAMMGFSAGGGFAALGKGAFGSVIGGTLAGAGVGMAAGAVGKHVFGSMVEGAQEQQVLERTLGQFKFQNTASRTGQGFSRQDQMAIGGMVRQMERMPEMLTSFGELNRVMDKMGQMGLMQGVRSVTDFMTKFKSTTDTLKDMAKMMGTTMEGALQAFSESRQAGFYSNPEIMKNVMNRQATGAVTGMDQQQVAAVQQYGAAVSHSRGGSRKGGAQAITRTAGQLGIMNQMGTLSNDQIMEMTGKEGAEGIADLAGEMTDLAHKMARSSVGTATALALGEMKDGRYTGKMDEALVEKYRSGGLSKGELLSMAHRKAATRGAKLSFAAHRSRITTEMANSVGAEGIGIEIQHLLGNRGWDNPDATNLVMQRFGASEEQANMLQTMMPNLEDIGLRLGQQRKEQAHISARNIAMEPQSFDAIKQRIATRVKHATTDWAKDLGVGIRDYFTEWADDFVDDMTGVYRTKITQRSVESIKKALHGNRAEQISLAGAAYANKQAGDGSQVLYDSGGLGTKMARFGLSLGGERSASTDRLESQQFFEGNRNLTSTTEGPGVGAVIGGAALSLIPYAGPVLGAAVIAGDMRTTITQNSIQKGRHIAEEMTAQVAAVSTSLALKKKFGDEGWEAQKKYLERIASTPEVRAIQDVGKRRAEIVRRAVGVELYPGELDSVTDEKELYPGENKEKREGGERWRAGRDAGIDDRSQLEATALGSRQNIARSSDVLLTDQSGSRLTGKALADKQKTLARQLTSSGFGDILKEAQSDSPLGKLLASGISSDDKKGVRFAGELKAEDLLHDTVFTANQKSMLRDAGYTDEKIHEWQEDREGRAKLADTLRTMSPEDKEKFVAALKADKGAALEEFVKGISESGASLRKAGDTKTSSSAAKLSRESKGKGDKFLKAMAKYGESQEEIGTIAGKKYSKETMEVAFPLAIETSQMREKSMLSEWESLDEKTRTKAMAHLRESGQEELALHLEGERKLDSRTKEAKKKGKRGKTNLFGQGGLLGGSETTVYGGDAQKAEQAKILADPAGYMAWKTGGEGAQQPAWKVQAGNEDIVNLFGKGDATLGLPKTGTKVQGGADEKVVAALFEKMTKNAGDTATILATIATKMGVDGVTTTPTPTTPEK